ncbi:hypothetical protein DFJ74DRAFT_759947 [Hyaloraphidium curvatum]|nr:hypothetical protein DFJ74DRAFT_759947 [Hyaloraphidium curvatum]
MVCGGRGSRIRQFWHRFAPHTSCTAGQEDRAACPGGRGALVASVGRGTNPRPPASAGPGGPRFRQRRQLPAMALRPTATGTALATAPALATGNAPATSNAPAAAATTAAARPSVWRCIDADNMMYVAVRALGGGYQCAGPDRLRCSFYADSSCTIVVSWSEAPSTFNGFSGQACRSYTQGWCLTATDSRAGVPLDTSWNGGAKAAAPPPDATTPSSETPTGPAETQDSGIYIIEPHGVNATSTATTTTRYPYGIYYATYSPTRVLSAPGQSDAFMTSDRITLITLVTLLIAAVLTTSGLAYYFMKRRKKQMEIDMKFEPPHFDSYGYPAQTPGSPDDFYDGASQYSATPSRMTGAESFYDEESDAESLRGGPDGGEPMSPSSPRSPVSPADLGTQSFSAVSSTSAPTPTKSQTWDDQSSSSRPSGATKTSNVGDQIHARQMRHAHISRLTRPLSKHDPQLVAPPEATTELRELALWLAQDLAPKPDA